MQFTFLMTALQLTRKFLAIVGAALTLLIGSHAFAQATDTTAVQGQAHPAAKVQWSDLFSY